MLDRQVDDAVVDEEIVGGVAFLARRAETFATLGAEVTRNFLYPARSADVTAAVLLAGLLHRNLGQQLAQLAHLRIET